jgi:hypothetical protein
VRSDANIPKLVARAIAMPDPKQHAQNRNWLESLGRQIPGFRGYLEKEYRRESDALQRNYLASQLQSSKRGLNDYARTLTDAGQLDALPQLERLRHRLDKLIARITSAMQGYSGMFDLVRVKEDVLDQVYEHDTGLVDEVMALSVAVDALGTKTEPPAALIAPLMKQIDEIDDAWNKREEILKGLT